MCVLVYKPDIMFSVSSRSRRPIRSRSTPLLSKSVKTSSYLQRIVIGCVCVEVVCAWEGVFGGDISLNLNMYKAITIFICIYLISIDMIVVCCKFLVHIHSLFLWLI